MADLKRLGMEPRDVDGYCCDTEIGQGDEVIAVLSHLDVVPEGEGWAHDPYGAEIIDGRMIGRGTSDDKGPGVAAAVRDEGHSERGHSAAPPLPPDSGLRRRMRHAGSRYITSSKIGLPDTRLLSGRELPADQHREGRPHAGAARGARATRG